MFAAIGALVLPILNLFVGPLMAFMTKRQDVALQEFQTNASTGLAAQQADNAAQAAANAAKEAAPQWWGWRALFLVIGGTAAFHFAALVWTLSAPPKYTWAVHLLPSPLNNVEVAILTAFFVIGPFVSYFRKA